MNAKSSQNRRSRWVAPPRASPLEREPPRHPSGRLSCCPLPPPPLVEEVARAPAGRGGRAGPRWSRRSRRPPLVEEVAQAPRWLRRSRSDRLETPGARLPDQQIGKDGDRPFLVAAGPSTSFCPGCLPGRRRRPSPEGQWLGQARGSWPLRAAARSSASTSRPGLPRWSGNPGTADCRAWVGATSGSRRHELRLHPAVDLCGDIDPAELLGWRDVTHVVVGPHRRTGRVVDIVTGDVEPDLAGFGIPVNPPYPACARWSGATVLAVGGGALLVRRRPGRRRP